MNKFERWCARNESKGIKNLIWYIIGGQVLVYIIMNTPVGGGFVYNWLSLMPTRILRGEVWRIITYAFIPQYGGVVNMLLSCLLTYFLGSTLERDWGRMKFTVYYLSGVLITAVYGIIIGFWYGDSVAYIMNTHWLNMSLFLAMSMLYPDAQLIVCPAPGMKIARNNWMHSREGIDAVLGELERCGAQFHEILSDLML